MQSCHSHGMGTHRPSRRGWNNTFQISLWVRCIRSHLNLYFSSSAPWKVGEAFPRTQAHTGDMAKDTIKQANSRGEAKTIRNWGTIHRYDSCHFLVDTRGLFLPTSPPPAPA